MLPRGLRFTSPLAGEVGGEAAGGLAFHLPACRGGRRRSRRVGAWPYRRPSLNPFRSPLVSAAAEPAMILASCSEPRERAVLGVVRTGISPPTRAPSGLCPSNANSNAS